MTPSVGAKQRLLRRLAFEWQRAELAVLGWLGLEQQTSWNLHLQISTQLRWLSSRTGSDGDEDGRRGELSVDCLFHPHRRFRIQKPGSYITPCSQAFATTIASLGYSLWSASMEDGALLVRSIEIFVEQALLEIEVTHGARHGNT